MYENTNNYNNNSLYSGMKSTTPLIAMPWQTEQNLQALSPKGNNNYEDNDYVPSKQRSVNSTNYSNTYLKRLNFRKELTDFISKSSSSLQSNNIIEITDKVLTNVYFEEQLDKSNSDILSESLKIELNRMKIVVDINSIKNLVIKYF